MPVDVMRMAVGFIVRVVVPMFVRVVAGPALGGIAMPASLIAPVLAHGCLPEPVPVPLLMIVPCAHCRFLSWRPVRASFSKHPVRRAELFHGHHSRMFIVTLTYLKPVEEIDPLMDAHVAWLRSHYDAGLFVASGRRVPRTGGVILARSGDRAALDAALAADPFAIHGAARFDVVEFTPTMTVAGAEILKSF